MSDIKPITLYGHGGKGPNPKKVAIIMEELGVPYETIVVEDVKGPEFTRINPNGRVPAIIDPNTNITLWESAAIIEYLLDTYDKDNKLGSATSPEKYILKQYAHFQSSGQGPYFGQTIWFHVFDKTNPAARQRYAEQAERVFMVLDNILKGKEYLIGDKLTYADLMFVPWDFALTSAMPNDAWNSETSPAKYPSFHAWNQRLLQRPSVKKVMGL